MEMAVHPRAAAILDHIATAVRGHLPPSITPAYLDSFLRRNRPALLQVIERHLIDVPGVLDESKLPPEEWTASRRTQANVAAMKIAAGKRPEKMSAKDKRILAGYSGWGGLSIAAVRDRFPPGFPAPEERGLIHEYYTPAKVSSEIARVVRPMLSGVGANGSMLALEPAAGIGRLVRAASGKGWDQVKWLAVEYSELSGRMLGAIRPDLTVYLGPFERWVREYGDDYRGRVHLVLANPPYGARGAAIADDPDRSYREKQAYAYFMRRSLDLLVPNGVGVFLVPYGFMTGQGARNRSLRNKVLRRHHLAAAYRLPSRLFPGASLVIDLLFIRARGGELDEVLEEDQAILDGGYFELFPTHILGKEVGKAGAETDQTAKPRWGYQVEGEFTKLPDVVERPLCTTCEIRRFAPPTTTEDAAEKPKARGGVTRRVTKASAKLPVELAAASALGLRVDGYLASLAAEDSEAPSLLWKELHEALTAWAKTHGNPWSYTELQKVVSRGDVGAERFMAAFERSGRLISGLSRRPVYRPRYTGQPSDVVAQAEMLFRQHRKLTLTDLAEFHRKVGGRTTPARIQSMLLKAGWALDGKRWDHLVPAEHYYSGHLWPKYDRAGERARRRDAQAVTQAKKLLAAIGQAVFEDIDGVSPRQGWVPLELVSQWLSETLNNYYGAVTLVRHHGLVVPDGTEYEGMRNSGLLAAEARWCIGWINHDKTEFHPRKRRDQNLDEIRLKMAREWESSFRAWIGADEDRRSRIEEVYNRTFLGFVTPRYPSEPLAVARWVKDGPTPHPHQVAGARRVLANRGGLIAFDVGVGKTYAAILLAARARQEGWVRRPVVLVPNSIIWKWEADILRVLPDYRVAVIGSKRKVMSRGPRKGLVTSATDTPKERAQKWTRFQAGEYDIVLLTYTALARTRMNERAVRGYAAKTEAIRREVKLRQRNAGKQKKITERQAAILKEGVAAWVAEQMELPPSWKYDPGIAWDDIGIDMLIVDEAQNFKNLYLPEAREGGVPRFMGNTGEGSKRAWQLDFRCASVRARTGGAGIVLLSATPAKNSPLEFYSLIQYVDHNAWSRMGIRDPEQFIDRYLRIELKPVVNTRMEVEERAAVTGFTNLHELRDTIFRYGEFRTADEVGLKLPEPTVKVVEVDMNAAQDAKYDDYVSQIEDALDSTQVQDRSKILGLLARMALVAIHPNLDEGYNHKSAGTSGVSPHSPKLDAMAKRVAANRTCGHIVFVDNIAAHVWARQVLIKAGIQEDRIAVLNAQTAKGSADRERIAREFNGVPEEGLAPKYDVVIANAIAYEGIDLQKRTCAIHHLDLPWEPATLQQRNGRGVRQGNTLATIEINYYFARRSQDGLRFNLIQGKLGWMTELLKSQKRDTNNPGAQMELGPEEILLLISREPEKTAQRLAEVKARREAEARAKVANDAARLLRSANARYRKAEVVSDPVEASRLRLEGEERLDDLAKVDPTAWPWARFMYAVRDNASLVTQDTGAPVYEGLRVGMPSQWNPEDIQYGEFGKVRGTTIGVRQAGSARWQSKELAELDAMGLHPDHYNAHWPDNDDDQVGSDLEQLIARDLRRWGNWHALNWQWAADTWIERWWPRFAPSVVESMAGASRYYVNDQKVPVVVDGKLRIAAGGELRRGDVLPPTLDGWREFLTLGPTSGLKWGELAGAGEYWWHRKVPRDLLVATHKPSGEEEGEAA